MNLLLTAHRQYVDTLYGPDSAAACETMARRLRSWIEYVEECGTSTVFPVRTGTPPEYVITRYQADMDSTNHWRELRESWNR